MENRQQPPPQPLNPPGSRHCVATPPPGPRPPRGRRYLREERHGVVVSLSSHFSDQIFGSIFQQFLFNGIATHEPTNQIHTRQLSSREPRTARVPRCLDHPAEQHLRGMACQPHSALLPSFVWCPEVTMPVPPPARQEGGPHATHAGHPCTPPASTWKGPRGPPNPRAPSPSVLMVASGCPRITVHLSALRPQMNPCPVAAAQGCVSPGSCFVPPESCINHSHIHDQRFH